MQNHYAYELSKETNIIRKTARESWGILLIANI